MSTSVFCTRHLRLVRVNPSRILGHLRGQSLQRGVPGPSKPVGDLAGRSRRFERCRRNPSLRNPSTIADQKIQKDVHKDETVGLVELVGAEGEGCTQIEPKTM